MIANSTDCCAIEKSSNKPTVYDESIRIRHINIKKSFNENVKRNIKYCTLEEYIKSISNKNYDSSFYEIFSRNDELKIYFDIEKIPLEEPKLIDNIISDLQTFFVNETKLELGNYIKTLNTGSESHNGLSYHVIFYEWKTTQLNILNLLNSFLEKYPQYCSFIDGGVYTNMRLFKSVNQIAIVKKGKKQYRSNIKNNMHIIVDVEENQTSISQSIIQNVTDCKKLNFCFKTLTETVSNQFSQGNTIKQTTTYVQKIENQEKLSITDEIYSIAFLLNLSEKMNEPQKKYIEELLNYYESHKSFENFKQTPNQILNILKMLKGN